MVIYPKGIWFKNNNFDPDIEQWISFFKNANTLFNLTDIILAGSIHKEEWDKATPVHLICT